MAKICSHGRQLCHCAICAPLADAAYRDTRMGFSVRPTRVPWMQWTGEEWEMHDPETPEWHPSYREIL